MLHDVRVLDETASFTEPLDVSVRHGRIDAATPDLRGRRDARHVDGAGILVLPGMIDCCATGRAGITSLRDAGGAKAVHHGLPMRVQAHGLFLTESDAALMAQHDCTPRPTLAIYRELAQAAARQLGAVADVAAELVPRLIEASTSPTLRA